MTDAKQYRHTCTLPTRSGKPCGRELGPYYNPAYLEEARARHKRAQHANTLTAMAAQEPGAARMRIASRTNPGYEAPTW